MMKVYMKKLILVVAFLAVFCFPALAEDSGIWFTFGIDLLGSADGITAKDSSDDLVFGYNLGLGWAPFIGEENILRAGFGTSFGFLNRLKDDEYAAVRMSNLAIYGTTVLHLGDIQVRLNLGYSRPFFSDAPGEGVTREKLEFNDVKGGLYFAVGLGYDLADGIFVEAMYNKHKWSLDDRGKGHKHFTIALGAWF